MNLLAISDLHVGFDENREALLAMRARPDDWLIVAGDVAERESDIVDALRWLRERFARVIWAPGNHELWTVSDDGARGNSKYALLVERCRAIDVLTPEDDYPIWSGAGGPHVIAPLFVLYDYSFADDGLSPAEALAWSERRGVVCADEALLHPDPFPSREDWCDHRIRLTEDRLAAAKKRHGLPMVLVNHFPLVRELAQLPAIPSFKIWCGTRRTASWPVRFGASVVVSGHLHIRSTRVIGTTRFEEVSLGYPGRQWDTRRGIDTYVRTILGPDVAKTARQERPWRV